MGTQLPLRLFYIQARLSSRQFHSIRSLEFCYFGIPDFSDIETNESWLLTWIGFCSILKSMKGLQHLQIWMVAPDLKKRLVTPALESTFFTHLMDIRGLEYFPIAVSWHATPFAEGLLQNAPFTLVRTDEDFHPDREGPVVCGLHPPEPELDPNDPSVVEFNRTMDRIIRKARRRRIFSYLNPFRHWTG